MAERARAYAVSSGRGRGPVELGAVLNTVCMKCGGSGHIASECFNTSGVKYELLQEDSGDAGRDGGTFGRGQGEKQRQETVGRGRGATLPAWMSEPFLGGTIKESRKADKVKFEKKSLKEEKKKLKKEVKRQKKEMKKKVNTFVNRSQYILSILDLFDNF